MRVLLSTFGTLGDIIPFSRLARALLARGHAVTFHTWPQFRAWVPDGATFAASAGAIDADAFAASMRDALAAPPLEQIRRFARMFYGLGDGPTRARAAYARAREVFAGHDVALLNFLDHLGQVAADELALPWLCYRSHPLGDPALADQLFASVDGELAALVADATGVTRRVRAWREHSHIATLVAGSPHLAPKPDDPRVVLTGGWLDPPAAEPMTAELDEFLAGGPALLVTFGIMPDLTGRTAALIHAAARTGWRAIVQVLPPAEPPAHVPDGILVARDRLPFAALFPRVAAVVHHASVGTLHEVVRAGRPSFTIPHMGDQFFWSDMLASRGLAPPPVPYFAIDEAVIATRLAALRDPAFAARAAELAPEIAAEDGVAVAVRYLESAT